MEFIKLKPFFNSKGNVLCLAYAIQVSALGDRNCADFGSHHRWPTINSLFLESPGGPHACSNTSLLSTAHTAPPGCCQSAHFDPQNFCSASLEKAVSLSAGASVSKKALYCEAKDSSTKLPGCFVLPPPGRSPSLEFRGLHSPPLLCVQAVKLCGHCSTMGGKELCSPLHLKNC